jgi:hypothetical protein
VGDTTPQVDPKGGQPSLLPRTLRSEPLPVPQTPSYFPVSRIPSTATGGKVIATNAIATTSYPIPTPAGSRSAPAAPQPEGDEDDRTPFAEYRHAPVERPVRSENPGRWEPDSRSDIRPVGIVRTSPYTPVVYGAAHHHPAPTLISTPVPGPSPIPTTVPAPAPEMRPPVVLPEPPAPSIREYAPATTASFSAAETEPEGWLWYARAEYLLWWTKDDRTAVPLATTSNLPTNPPNPLLPDPGAADDPTSVVLFGDQLQRSSFSGLRWAFGMALDDCGSKFFEIGGFFLGQRSANADISANSILARRFNDLNFGIPSAEIVNDPGFQSGRIEIRSPSQLWGLEANYLCKWCCGCDYRFDWLIGGRYLNLKEELSITERIFYIQDVDPVGFPQLLAGTTVVGNDTFSTRNEFYGGQIGVHGRWQQGRYSIDGRAKLALGVTHQSLRIDGSQVFSGPGAVNADPRPGGLYALNSNIGSFSKSQFSVVPEIGVNLGYDISENLRVSAGYNFLYWTNVIRPGDQLDPNLNVNRIPNFLPVGFQAPQPAVDGPQVLFKQSDYWAHGLTFGVELRY